MKTTPSERYSSNTFSGNALAARLNRFSMPRTPVTRYVCDRDGCGLVAESADGWFVVIPGEDPRTMMIAEAPCYERMVGHKVGTVESWLCGAACMLDYVRSFAGVPARAKAGA